MYGFTYGYIGEVMTRDGAIAVYFRTAQAARRHTDRFYQCWVPNGAHYYEDAE